MFSTNFRVRLQLAELFNGLKTMLSWALILSPNPPNPTPHNSQTATPPKQKPPTVNRASIKRSFLNESIQVSGPQTLTKQRHKAGMERGGAGCQGQDSNNHTGLDGRANPRFRSGGAHPTPLPGKHQQTQHERNLGVRYLLLR